MRVNRLLFSAFLFLMAVSRLSDAAFYDPKLKWKTVDTEHFSIHFYEGEEEIARRLVQISEEVYASLSWKFDARPWGKTEVVLGGIIPESDKPKLLKLGVARVYTPKDFELNTILSEIVDLISVPSTPSGI